MDNCSYFLENKGLFGSYPTQEIVNELEKNGVRYFIDLTTLNEKKTITYNTNYNYIKYPIKDQYVPDDWLDYSMFIIKIKNIIDILNENEKIYIHCKGGHGRAGIVVACLLCYIKKISPEQSIKYTTFYHNNRKNMEEKWRIIGSPQTKSQRQFIIEFFKPYIFNRTNKDLSDISPFSNYSQYSVKIPDLGLFPNAESAWYAFKNLNDIEYINNLKKCHNASKATLLGNKYKNKNNNDWDEIKEEKLEIVLRYKLLQHPYIKEYLLNTGLRPIYEYTIDDNKNLVGKILYKLREEFMN